MKKSAVLVCQLVVKKLIGNDPCNFKILGVHASLTSQSGQISIRKAPKMDVIHFFFWVFLVQTHFPSIVSPVFLFFGSTSLNPTEKILRSWEWREDAHHKIVKLDQLNQLMFETRSKIGETSMGNQPSLGSLGFRNLMQKSHGGYEGELWRVIPLAAGCNHWGLSKWVNLNPAKRDDSDVYHGASWPKVTRAKQKSVGLCGVTAWRL